MSTSTIALSSPKEESCGTTGPQVVDKRHAYGNNAEDEGVEGDALSRTDPLGEQVGGDLEDDCEERTTVEAFFKV